MSVWADLGLPSAQSSDYQYDVDAGLLRTPFDTAQARQTRQHTKNKRTFSFHIKLTRAQLRTALNYLKINGYSWFSLPLLSGYMNEEIVGLCVRLTQDPNVSAEGNDTYKLQMTVEQLVERSILVTTTLYPVESADSLATGNPDPVTGGIRPTSYYELLNVTRPDVGGTLVQTYFPHYLTEEDYITVGAPDTVTGLLGQTYYPRAYGDMELIQTIAPDVPTGLLGQMYYPITSDNYDELLVGAPDAPTGGLA